VTSVSAELVQCLLREQFPQWAHEPVRSVEVQGWDNRTYRVGHSLAARLPSAEGYAAAVGKEQRWLPVLAPQLPVPIPVPLGHGQPGCGFRWPWTVYAWLPGRPAGADQLTDPVRFARDLGAFLTALQAVDPTNGPAPGPHSAWRGGPLTTYDAETRAAATALAGLVDEAAVLQVWDAALVAPARSAKPVWVHGDVVGSNLLVAEGRLVGVLDFGCCAVGDPACDLVVAWTLFHAGAREAFRARVDADRATWARARGWALWKALLTLADGPDGAAAERRYGWRCSATDLITELVEEHRGAGLRG
jgi:aminoglycoside phosphotransferase (APT) family kinase protein